MPGLNIFQVEVHPLLKGNAVHVVDMRSFPYFLLLPQNTNTAIQSFLTLEVHTNPIEGFLLVISAVGKDAIV